MWGDENVEIELEEVRTAWGQIVGLLELSCVIRGRKLGERGTLC